MEPTNSPTAQGQQGQEPKSDGADGIQKRFDELTARYHAAEKQAEEARKQNAQQAQLIAELQLSMMEKVQAAPAAPQPQVDPERAKEIDAVVSPQMQRLMAQMQQLQSQLGLSQVRQAGEAVKASPEVLQRAQAYAAHWTRNGIPFEPRQALWMAMGEQADAAARVAPPPTGTTPVLTPTAGLPIPPPLVNSGSLPAEFSSWSPDKQNQYLDEHQPDIRL